MLHHWCNTCTHTHRCSITKTCYSRRWTVHQCLCEQLKRQCKTLCTLLQLTSGHRCTSPSPYSILGTALPGGLRFSCSTYIKEWNRWILLRGVAAVEPRNNVNGWKRSWFSSLIRRIRMRLTWDCVVDHVTNVRHLSISIHTLQLYRVHAYCRGTVLVLSKLWYVFSVF